MFQGASAVPDVHHPSAGNSMSWDRKTMFLSRSRIFQYFLNGYQEIFSGSNPYMRAVDPPADPLVSRDGKILVMLGSNNYLGLATHPEVKKAAHQAIEQMGTGCCSSRLLTGTMTRHLQLEKELAKFKHQEDVLLFSTGYMAMMGTISAIMQKDDIILSDQLNHASIIDGIRLSPAQVRIYRHSDMSHLEEHLASCPARKNKLIVTDGVFSMKGDICRLPDIIELAKKYDALVMVDDAHGTGILGKNGRGVAEHFGVEEEIDISACTFSKVFGAIGGAVGSDHRIIEFLRYQSRPYMFTASLPPSVVQTVLTALRVMQKNPGLRVRLKENVKFLRENLAAVGFRLEPTVTPILPLLIGDDRQALQLALELEKEGVFVNPVIPPAVSAESSLIRISVMASLSRDELKIALDKFKKVGKRLGLI